MVRSLLIFPLFLLISKVSAQNNLVINPDFEETDLLPIPTNPGIYYVDADATNWFGNYYYFHTAHPYEIMQHPDINDSVKNAYSGYGCVSFCPYMKDISMDNGYLEGFLTTPLIIRHTYKLSFYYCSDSHQALDLRFLDVCISNHSHFEIYNKADLPYSTLSFNLINNGQWNKAEGTFVAEEDSVMRIAFGIFKKSNVDMNEMDHKYNKARYHLNKTLQFFEINNNIFYPKSKSKYVGNKPFYIDENEKVQLYDSFKMKCETQKKLLFGNIDILYGKELGKSEFIWPIYYIDNIELYDITNTK